MEIFAFFSFLSSLRKITKDYEGNRSSFVKITPTWNALPNFFAKFSPSENNHIYSIYIVLSGYNLTTENNKAKSDITQVTTDFIKSFNIVDVKGALKLMQARPHRENMSLSPWHSTFDPKIYKSIRVSFLFSLHCMLSLALQQSVDRQKDYQRTSAFFMI